MKHLRVRKGHLKRTVIVPSSKSYANRALILAAQKSLPFTITDLPHASDVTQLVDCLKKIGITFSGDLNHTVVLNSFPECESEGGDLFVGEGGTTARFIAAMLLLGKKTYHLHLGERLKDRPWQEFLNLARQLGGTAELSNSILTVKGPLIFPEILKIDCSQTTQFASAFQLIAPPSCKIEFINLSSSESYLKMTEKIIQDFSSEDHYAVPKDWSSASYALAFGALNHEITFPGLKKDTFQADAKFLSILKKYHSIIESSDGLSVQPMVPTGSLAFNVSDALDLVPTLAYFLSHIEGKHELTGIKNLVHKESNRLDEVIKLLKIFNRKAWTRENSLFIEGNPRRMEDEIDLNLPNDHRIVMMGTLFLLHHAGGSISPAEAVNKSYPDFFDLITYS